MPRSDAASDALESLAEQRMVFAAIRNQRMEAVTTASRVDPGDAPAVSALPSVLVVDDIEANLVAMEALFEGAAATKRCGSCCVMSSQ